MTFRILQDGFGLRAWESVYTTEMARGSGGATGGFGYPNKRLPVQPHEHPAVTCSAGYRI